MDRFRAKNVLVAVVVVATLIRVWLGPITLDRPALAQIPDAGAQRKELVEELRQTNQMLAEIKTLLAERTLNVRVVAADKP